MPTYTAPAAPAPRVPVVTKKTVTADESILFSSITSHTDSEYPDYRKVTQAGANGLKRIYTEITYTDGTETGRVVVKSEVVTAPVNEQVAKGNRTKPLAKLISFKKTSKKDKYDISGQYRANSEVVLALDGRRIKRAMTNNKGVFVFKGIKVASSRPSIEIYNRVNRKEAKISEKTTVTDKSKSTLLTDYNKLHPVKPDQTQSVQAKPVAQTIVATQQAAANDCEPNYSPCIKNVPGDLDCADIKITVKVIGTDRYRLDRDKDGLGCE